MWFASLLTRLRRRPAPRPQDETQDEPINPADVTVSWGQGVVTSGRGRPEPVRDLEARIHGRTRVYEGADYERLLSDLSTGIDVGHKAEVLNRAQLEIAIAKDYLANVYALRTATNSLVKSSRRLEGLTRWLVGLTVVLAALTSLLVYDVARRLLGR